MTIIKYLIVAVVLFSWVIVSMDFYIIWNHVENYEAVKHALASIFFGGITIIFGEKVIMRMEKEDV